MALSLAAISGRTVASGPSWPSLAKSGEAERRCYQDDVVLRMRALPLLSDLRETLECEDCAGFTADQRHELYALGQEIIGVSRGIGIDALVAFGDEDTMDLIVDAPKAIRRLTIAYQPENPLPFRIFRTGEAGGMQFGPMRRPYELEEHVAWLVHGR